MRLAFFSAALLGALAAFAAEPKPPHTPEGTIAIECEDFEYIGDWQVFWDGGSSNGRNLVMQSDARNPAVTAVNIPHDGKYVVWVRSRDYEYDKPGVRNFQISLDGKVQDKIFGKHGKEGYAWEKAGVVDLKKGPLVLGLHNVPGSTFGRADAIVISDRLNINLTGTFAIHRYETSPIVRMDVVGGEAAEVNISNIEGDASAKAAAAISNEFMRAEFYPVKRAGKDSFAPRLKIKTAGGFKDAKINAGEESYQVLEAAENVQMHTSRLSYHPTWENTPFKTVTLRKGDVEMKTTPIGKNLIWNTGFGKEAIVKSVRQLSENSVELEFYPLENGTLKARWALSKNENYIRAEMEFTPNKDGNYSLGYFFPAGENIENVDELLMPMMVMGKRFPKGNYSMRQGAAPTPMSVMQLGKGADAITMGIAGDADYVPFEFPTPVKSRYVMHIKDAKSQVHPSIYGPIIGTEHSIAHAGKAVKFPFNIIVQNSEWYGAYRNVADNIYGLKDYRENTLTSLTESVLNMIDLYMDDDYGGWWTRAKGSYQIESLNGSSNSTILTPLSLYRLTGNYEIYKKRALPTMEFSLSRHSEHFSPIPEATGHYPKGNMSGPIPMFGAASYSGLWELSNRLTPKFFEIAFPDGKEKIGSNAPAFADTIARYEYTQDKADLQRAMDAADNFIKRNIDVPYTDDIGVNPFFLVSYVPHWQALLRLYEITGEPRYLDAAQKGAHSLMTGIWTQPKFSQKAVIHKDGKIGLDKPHMWLYKGAEKFRLGFPIEAGAFKEHEVDAWKVSNVGLGFEQPTTYAHRDQGGRMIMNAPWAPAFLRLAQYTKDKTFETYARNAVLGRWGNYPGYYYTDFTDIEHDPQYPYKGPDLGYIYYHHLPVHLSWAIDYLVADTVLRSNGEISFPSLKQFGYAFFDYQIYGHKPGKIHGHEGAWMWLAKDLVKLDNPQINHLCAHTADKFFVILTNQSQEMQTFTLSFNPSKISKGAKGFESAKLLPSGAVQKLENNAGSLTLGPRAQMVLMVEGLDINVESHKTFEAEKKAEADSVNVACEDKVRLRAEAIQIDPRFWDAFVWLDAPSQSFKEVTLKITDSNGKAQTLKCGEYPYEFSVHMPSGVTGAKFQIEGIRKDGSKFKSPSAQIGIEK